MIDTHCHLLPGLDDGPRRDAEAVELARSLWAQGVRHVVCTPHYSSLFATDHEAATRRFHGFVEVLESEEIGLTVSLAAEIGPGFAVTEPLDELRRRTIAGRFALIEVLPDTSASDLLTIGERLGEAGIEIVLAHPERCRALHRHPGILDPLRADGAVVQIVAPSLIGRWGPDVELAAWRLVDTGRADILASDAHGATRRRPHLREACDLIDGRLGSELVAELTERGPLSLLEGQGVPRA